MRTGSYQGVKRPGRGLDHPLPSSAEAEERVELYIYFPSGPSWPVIGRPLQLPVPDLTTYVMFNAVVGFTSEFRRYTLKNLKKKCLYISRLE